VLATIDQCG